MTVDGVFGDGVEDLEDPEDLREQGKQPFDHDLSTTLFHASIVGIFPLHVITMPVHHCGDGTGGFFKALAC